MISYKLIVSRASIIAAVFLASAVTAQTVAITGGKVYPVSGPAIENGTVVITNGKISAVGANVPIPAGAPAMDPTCDAAFTAVKAGPDRRRSNASRPIPELGATVAIG